MDNHIYHSSTHVQKLPSTTELSSLAVSQLTLFISIVQSARFIQRPGLYHILFGWIIIQAAGII